MKAEWLHITDSTELEKQIQELSNRLVQLQWEKWRQEDFLQPYWWLLLFSTILPWVIWWRIADKKRFSSLLQYGLLWALTAFLLDSIGISLSLWTYPRQLVVATPPMFPADGAVIPVVFMLAYQYGTDWKRYLLWNTLASIFFSYIIEPWFTRIHLYQPAFWSSHVSFAGFLILAYILRYFSELLWNRNCPDTSKKS